MDLATYNLGIELNNQRVRYILHKPLWERFQYPHLDTRFAQWTSIKYLNDDASNFSDEIDTIPSTEGGLYLFFIKCPIIEGITEFPFYIGRAQLTGGQNLRKRVKEYFQKYSRNDERPKIFRMLKNWGKDLHVAFLVVADNEDTVNLEKDIINFLLLPMNDSIPDKTIKAAVAAFE